MSVSIRRWLESRGFQSDPFEFWEADRETRLSSYFVRAEWFDALCGEPDQPRSGVLFAPRGAGKSSHRVQIAQICGASGDNPALVVQLVEYGWLLAEGLGAVDERRYLVALARLVVRALFAQIAQNPARRAALAADAQALLRAHGLLRWSAEGSLLFYPEIELPDEACRALARQLRLPGAPPPTPDDLVDEMAHRYQHADQGQIMDDMLQVAHAARFASIYVLVDRVDELGLTESDPESSLLLLRPLISNLTMVEHPGYAFKFFLPDHLYEPMVRQRIGRIEDRLPCYTMTWRDHELRELLARRLAQHSLVAGASNLSLVPTFQSLCEPGLDADARLVAAARRSPRRMIILANRIIEHHCRDADSVDSLIDAGTLANRLEHAVPLLYLDPAGRIWLGGRPQDIRLPKMRRRLLELLWENRTRYMTTDEIARVLYVDQQPESLYKLVLHLRNELEPHLRNSKNYIDYVEGTGYRLLNFEE